MRSNKWKKAVLTILLSLAASPALASGTTSGSSAAAVDLSTGAVDLDRTPAGLRRITERVTELEQRVDQLGVASAPRAPTAAELKRARLEQERQAEFLNQIWTAP